MSDFKWVRSDKLTELEQNYPWPTGAIVLDTETTGLYPYERPNEHARYYGPDVYPADEILQLSIMSAHNGRTLFNQLQGHVARREVAGGASGEDAEERLLLLRGEE